ncbi:MAG: exo-alpha-sialidase [Cryomorphaceae bacterium]
MTTRIHFVLLFTLLAHLCQAQEIPTNVLIHAQDNAGGYPPCEPSIAVDPADPSKLVGGAVLDYVFTSSDTGKTWSVDRLSSEHGVYGDPCVIPGEKGQFYYFHLSDPSGRGWASDDILDRIVCHRLKKWGGKWDKGWGIGHNPIKDQDKEWAVWDPIQKRLVVTWTQFDAYGSDDSSCESNIMLASSKNGKRWTKAVDISSVSGNCIDNSGTNEGAVPAIYTDGSICVAWSLNGNIHFKRLKSSKAGVSVIEENIAVTGGANWSFDIPGLGRANGMPITLVDLSHGPHHGTIYINWADQRNGADDTDIWVSASTDGGKTWSAPTRVNDDPPGKQQFFTWMAIDQSTGTLHCVFYDRRNYEDHGTDVFIATSSDGGTKWVNKRISESPFFPKEGVFFGDYNNISAAQGVVRPIWTRYDDGKLSVWTALID